MTKATPKVHRGYTMKKQAGGQANKKEGRGRLDTMDGRLPNFGERIEASGRRSYFYSAKINNKHCFKSFGAGLTREQAKALYTAFAGKVAVWKMNGCQPGEANPFQRAESVTAPKFSRLFENYLVQRIRTETNRPEDREKYLRWQARKYFGEFWNKRVDLITPSDVVALRDSFGAKHHSANRCLQTLSACFKWATTSVDGQPPVYKGGNPAAGVTKYEEHGRERYLSPTEMNRLYDGLADEPSQDLKDYLVIALETGVRKMAILSAKWEDVKSQACWIIPRASSKSGKSYPVSLSPEVVKVFQRRRRENPDSRFIFPGRSGGHRSDLYLEWDGFRKRCGFPDVRLHDIRRTTGANLAQSGASAFVLRDALGHVSLSSVEFYARLNHQAVTKALANSREYSRREMLAARKNNRQLKAVNS